MKKLVIVGRPNVGKSALFNRICRRSIAIVDPSDGVTRDRLYAPANFQGLAFQVVDTGGIDARSEDHFRKEIKKQALRAIEEADTLVMVVDAHAGITDLDEELAALLLKTKKPVVLAVNKIDNEKQKPLLHDFYSLGIAQMIPTSAAHGYEIDSLLETAWKGFTLKPQEPIPSTTKIALVGRPNVGKSTLVNFLVEEERSVVSPIPGTTRDMIDIPFSIGEKEYLLIDTAGVRRKKLKSHRVDKKAITRTEKAIRRCDIALLLLDVQDGITSQDKRIIKTIQEAGKGFVVLFNKWDLAHGFRMEHCAAALKEESPFLQHVPTLFISAKEGRNVKKIFSAIHDVDDGLKRRIPTPQLNTFLERVMQSRPPAMVRGKRLRIYYATQAETQPPSFSLFINYPDLMQDNYKRYLLNELRKSFSFPGVPLQFNIHGKEPISIHNRVSS